MHRFDRGSRYAAGDYRKALAARGITVWMSRKGRCWDKCRRSPPTARSNVEQASQAPERGTLALLDLGLAGLAAARRCKRWSATPDDKPALVAGFFIRADDCYGANPRRPGDRQLMAGYSPLSGTLERPLPLHSGRS